MQLITLNPDVIQIEVDFENAKGFSVFGESATLQIKRKHCGIENHSEVLVEVEGKGFPQTVFDLRGKLECLIRGYYVGELRIDCSTKINDLQFYVGQDLNAVPTPTIADCAENGIDLDNCIGCDVIDECLPVPDPCAEPEEECDVCEHKATPVSNNPLIQQKEYVSNYGNSPAENNPYNKSTYKRTYENSTVTYKHPLAR